MRSATILRALASTVSAAGAIAAAGIKHTASSVAALPATIGSAISSIDPYGKGCVIAQKVMVFNPLKTETAHAAFVYCQDFFKIYNPFTRAHEFPSQLADLFRDQACADICLHPFKLAYNSACSAAGSVYNSWPHYATHVVAENVTCAIDGVKFTVLPNVTYCFAQLTDLAGKTRDDIQLQLYGDYTDSQLLHHKKAMLALGVSITALAGCALWATWRHRRNQYRPIVSSDSDTLTHMNEGSPTHRATQPTGRT